MDLFEILSVVNFEQQQRCVRVCALHACMCALCVYVYMCAKKIRLKLKSNRIFSILGQINLYDTHIHSFEKRKKKQNV